MSTVILVCDSVLEGGRIPSGEDHAQYGEQKSTNALVLVLFIHAGRADTCFIAITYPVFDVIPHSFFEPMSYRIGVK